jgi:Asp-tRNA(Asn)/Glu-tRNA(Gln) amidotransferase A subunit family amidase
MYAADACTLPVNMAGLPALSVPCGLADGLPVGLQLMGPAWSELSLLRLGRAYEAITAAADWRALKPPGLAAAADPTTPTPAERAAVRSGGVP